MGLTLGQPEHEALATIGKSGVSLTITHGGNKEIVTDTAAIGECDINFRRSLGFDSTKVLTAVGMTHLIPPTDKGESYDCIIDMLRREYGEPAKEIVDGVTQMRWDFGANMLTFEQKVYNENDEFLLIYYYRKKDFPS